ncbi:sugar ABC transporter permease [Gemmiger formicilis]|uniref:sugar ABC transporter permease n=1 Tax=Gemmiger formicilis TaxID=745368 RepID=UPI00117A0C47|nr:sugar ABC transporter permease [Gemmiger formicilis]
MLPTAFSVFFFFGFAFPSMWVGRALLPVISCRRSWGVCPLAEITAAVLAAVTRGVSWSVRAIVVACRFIVAVLVGFWLFALLPLIFAVVVSFCDWFCVAPVALLVLGEFVALLGVQAFRVVFVNLLVSAFGMVLVSLLFSLGLAMFVTPEVRFLLFLCGVSFLPYVGFVFCVVGFWALIFSRSLGPVKAVFVLLVLFSVSAWACVTEAALLTVLLFSVLSTMCFCLVICLCCLPWANREVAGAAALVFGRRWPFFWPVALVWVALPCLFFLFLVTIALFPVFAWLSLLLPGCGGSACLFLFSCLLSVGLVMRLWFWCASAFWLVLFVVLVFVRLVRLLGWCLNYFWLVEGSLAPAVVATSLGSVGAYVVVVRFVLYAVLLVVSGVVVLSLLCVFSGCFSVRAEVFWFLLECVVLLRVLPDCVGVWPWVPLLCFVRRLVFVCVVVSVLPVVLSFFVAFAFSRVCFAGVHVLLVGCLVGLAVLWGVSVVPAFVVVRFWLFAALALCVVFLPAFGGFVVFVVPRFSGCVGCAVCGVAGVVCLSGCGLCARMVVFVCVPAVWLLVLFAFVPAWAAFVGPLVCVRARAVAAVSLGVCVFFGRYSGAYGLLVVAFVVVLLPVVVVFVSLAGCFVAVVAFSGVGGWFRSVGVCPLWGAAGGLPAASCFFVSRLFIERSSAVWGFLRVVGVYAGWGFFRVRRLCCCGLPALFSCGAASGTSAFVFFSLLFILCARGVSYSGCFLRPRSAYTFGCAGGGFFSLAFPRGSVFFSGLLPVVLSGPWGLCPVLVLPVELGLLARRGVVAVCVPRRRGVHRLRADLSVRFALWGLAQDRVLLPGHVLPVDPLLFRGLAGVLPCDGVRGVYVGLGVSLGLVCGDVRVLSGLFCAGGLWGLGLPGRLPCECAAVLLWLCGEGCCPLRGSWGPACPAVSVQFVPPGRLGVRRLVGWPRYRRLCLLCGLCGFSG